MSEMGLNIVKVDVTLPENQWLVQELNLEATPTIWAFIDGRAVGPPLVGFLGEAGYRDVFERIAKFAASRRSRGGE